MHTAFIRKFLSAQLSSGLASTAGEVDLGLATVTGGPLDCGVRFATGGLGGRAVWAAAASGGTGTAATALLAAVSRTRMAVADDGEIGSNADTADRNAVAAASGSLNVHVPKAAEHRT